MATDTNFHTLVGDDFFEASTQAGPLSISRTYADLQERAHALMRGVAQASSHAGFLSAFEELLADLLAQLRAHPDEALTALIFDAGQERAHYSARHALLCAALGYLCAQRLGWPDDWRQVLTRVGLSMNLSIAPEQDRLATLAARLAESQRNAMKGHGVRTAELLELCGVRDMLWLDTICLHHDAGPGPLASRPAAHQLARMIERIDIFCARLSPRASRRAQSGAAAARAVYMDEQMKPDEAGAVLIRCVGMYPPGTLVRLANGETGLVCRRGARATMATVAALAGPARKAYGTPIMREADQGALAIVTSLAPHESQLAFELDRVLELC